MLLHKKAKNMMSNRNLQIIKKIASDPSIGFRRLDFLYGNGTGVVNCPS